MTGYEPAGGTPNGARPTPGWPFDEPVEVADASGSAATVSALGTFQLVADDESRDRRSRLRLARNVTLVALLVVLLVLAVVFGPTAWQITRERGTSIATPAEVAGLTADESPNARETADYLRTALAAQTPLRTTVGAVYVDQGGEPRSVIFIGGTGLLLSPGKHLAATFALVSDDSGGVDDVRAVPAGPLGGIMRCGTTRTDDGTMAVCGWADHGCLGVAMFPNRSTAESAHLLLAMRAEMQRRG